MTTSCPICGKPEAPATKPFCSRHCASIDLGRWLTSQYVLPGRDGEALAPEDSQE